jgi:hypothetical protein
MLIVPLLGLFYQHDEVRFAERPYSLAAVEQVMDPVVE